MLQLLPLASPIRARSACALHMALASHPAGAVGELWGSTGLLVTRCILVTQGAALRLLPLDDINFTNTPTGAEWDQIGSLDYRWLPINTAALPSWTASGLVHSLTTPGALYNPGLARTLFSFSWCRATTAPTTFSGSPTASVPRVAAGFWRVAGGISAGFVGGSAVGTLASALWSRALCSGDPDNPSPLGSPTGSLTAPSSKAIPIIVTCIGVAQGAARAIVSGGWQPDEESGGTAPALNSSMGAVGNAHAPALSVRPGDATRPASVTWTSFAYGGLLAAA